MSRNRTKLYQELDPKLLTAISEWKKLSHTELAIACQAMFALATNDENRQWIRESAEAIKKDLQK